MASKAAKQVRVKLAQAKNRLVNSHKPVVRAATQAQRINKIGADIIFYGWVRRYEAATPAGRKEILRGGAA